MASVTVTLPHSAYLERQVQTTFYSAWEPPPGSYVSIGDTLSADGIELFIGTFRLRNSTAGTFSYASLHLASDQVESESNPGENLSTVFEMQGIIECVASDGSTLTITGGISDTTEPYDWNPSISFSLIRAFASAVDGLADHSLTLTFNDNVEGNSAPTITAIAANPTTVDENGVVTLTATVSDPDII